MSKPAARVSARDFRARRIQYRVGHGGFHATIVTPTVKNAFDPLVYVYDAGANPRVSLLTAAIRRFVKLLVSEDIREVQYVIVSHIDADHVNRLNYLLTLLDKNSIRVGKLLLPWLDPLSKLLALSRTSSRQPSTVVRNLLQDATAVVQYAASFGVEEVGFVVPEPFDDNGGGGELPDPESAITPRGTAVHGVPVPSGTLLTPQSSPRGAPWKLVLSHLEPPKATLDAFRDEIIRVTGLDPNDPANHMTLLRSPSKKAATANRKTLASAMNAAARATGLPYGKSTITNWSSMTLYGASILPRVPHTVPASPNDFEWECAHGWLHTGDFPVDYPPAWTAIQKAWRRGFSRSPLCVVVAPHHGSKLTHNPDLYDLFDPSAVLFTFGLDTTGTRGNPRYSKLVDPKPAQRSVRRRTAAKIRPLNNRV